MRLRGRLIRKSHHLAYGTRRRRFIMKIESRIPEYPHVLDTLAGGGGTGIRKYPWRELDIVKVLERMRPKRIVELGSGASSAVFAAFVRETPGASLLSYDSSESCAELTRQALLRTG